MIIRMYKYYEYIKKSEERYELRLERVQEALEKGNKPTAKKYSTTVKTVRKWVRWYPEEKKAGLVERSRRPQTSPRATRTRIRFQMKQEVGTRKREAQLRQELELQTTDSAQDSAGRRAVLRQEKWAEKKKDVREVKKQLRAFEKLQLDGKHRDDIPELYKEFLHHPLPNYPFTTRCVRTEAVCFAYAREKSGTNAARFMLYLNQHVQSYGISLSGSGNQTDNGTSPWNSLKQTVFPQGVEKGLGATHPWIPPGANTFPRDGESFHW